ncbi:hypothetical protein AMIS_28840 [Actinoplanes missouriensis 431]|uniref:Uncharacterized protein n=1 Tax=Actinoplanes missouriensis (strain ATCC 14538 / DSM 43046 / CBS 188.64 / JCM 3121 / NBRC 102363 / NCIMB 12654 / NRRL B-3342 / UNCC 431) TaxID=512565 RepID=I0H517_ACTM4|nr:hypothetical protein [Actinoplanes missouriensis]BAL88104.1 hypothetical protein AMIS_28840 [Actinoplanes missouriensis 431]
MPWCLRVAAACVAVNLVGIAVSAQPAAASLAFDEKTGVGFVDKAHVQRAFGWSAAMMQENARHVMITSIRKQRYAATCSRAAPPGARKRTIRVTVTAATVISTRVTYQPRVKNQMTGIALTGRQSTTVSGVLPRPGQPCGARSGRWTHVDRTGTTIAVRARFGSRVVRLR